MRALPATLLLLASALPAVAAAQSVMEAPLLSQGDFWERTRGDLVLREGVEGIETIEVGGEPHEAVRLVERTMPAGDSSGSEASGGAVRTTWLRVSDHALLRTRIEESPSGPVWVEEAEAPCVRTRWPLALSEGWTVACTFRVQEEGSDKPVNVTLHRQVAWEGNVSTRVGLRHAFLVETRANNASGPLVSREWYAPAVCGVVRSEDYGATAVVTEIHGFRCAEAPPERAHSPTPSMIDTCSGVPGARCTPGPLAAETVATLGLVALVLLARRRG